MTWLLSAARPRRFCTWPRSTGLLCRDSAQQNSRGHVGESGRTGSDKVRGCKPKRRTQPSSFQQVSATDPSGRVTDHNRAVSRGVGRESRPAGIWCPDLAGLWPARSGRQEETGEEISSPLGPLRALTSPGDHLPRAQRKQGRGHREEPGGGRGVKFKSCNP